MASIFMSTQKTLTPPSYKMGRSQSFMDDQHSLRTNEGTQSVHEKFNQNQASPYVDRLTSDSDSASCRQSRQKVAQLVQAMSA